MHDQADAPAPPPRRTVEAYGRRLTWRDYGGTGQAVVLLHGLGGSSLSWQHVAPQLAAAGHRVRALDCPTVAAEHPHRSNDYSIAAAANQVRDLLQRLNVHRASLVGHSWGGGLALQVAYQHPGLVRSLALVASGGLGPEVTLPLRLTTTPLGDLVLPLAANALATAALGAALRAVEQLPTVRRLAARHNVPGLLRDLSRLREPARRRAFLATTRAVVDWRGQRLDGRAHLATMEDLPTLIIWGNDDPVLPVHHGIAAEHLHHNIALHQLPGTGHFPHVTVPDEVASALIPFLDRTGEDRAPTLPDQPRLIAA